MWIPLVVLAVLSVVGGWVGIPHALGGRNHFAEWLQPVIVDARGSQAGTVPAHEEHAAEAAAGDERATEWTLMGVSLLVAALGIALGLFIYLRRPAIATQAEHALGGVPYRWSLNKYFVDEFYNKYFPIGATLGLSRLLMRVDADGIDLLPNGSAWVAQMLSRVSSWFDTYVVDLLVNLQGWIVRGGSVVLRSVQTGFVQNYALLMVIGLLAFFIVYLVR